MQVVGSCLIVYFLLLTISAALMIYGIREGVRGWLLPWLILWFVICVFLLVFGLWLLGGYYIYVSVEIINFNETLLYCNFFVVGLCICYAMYVALDVI